MSNLQTPTLALICDPSTGAHFKFNDLCNRLENFRITVNPKSITHRLQPIPMDKSKNQTALPSIDKQESLKKLDSSTTNKKKKIHSTFTKVSEEKISTSDSSYQGSPIVFKEMPFIVIDKSTANKIISIKNLPNKVENEPISSLVLGDKYKEIERRIRKRIKSLKDGAEKLNKAIQMEELTSKVNRCKKMRLVHHISSDHSFSIKFQTLQQI